MLLAALLATLLAAAPASASATATITATAAGRPPTHDPNDDATTAPVRQLLTRVVGPPAAAKFLLAVISDKCPSSPVGECATVSDAPGGMIAVAASSVSSLAFGVSVCRCCHDVLIAAAPLRPRCAPAIHVVNSATGTGVHSAQQTDSGAAGPVRWARTSVSA